MNSFIDSIVIIAFKIAWQEIIIIRLKPYNFLGANSKCGVMSVCVIFQDLVHATIP